MSEKTVPKIVCAGEKPESPPEKLPIDKPIRKAPGVPFPAPEVPHPAPAEPYPDSYPAFEPPEPWPEPGRPRPSKPRKNE
jgi:hypothetical protein